MLVKGATDLVIFDGINAIVFVQQFHATDSLIYTLIDLIFVIVVLISREGKCFLWNANWFLLYQITVMTFAKSKSLFRIKINAK